MHHSGANVYKGMVGLFPMHDPKLDPGDERITSGLRSPGVPNPVTGPRGLRHPAGAVRLRVRRGVTPHKDFHNGCGETHPDWWGQTYFRHLVNRGFVATPRLM
jgi:hypothetical protein